MKKIGMIGAMQVEIEQIKSAMTDVTETEIAGSTFYEGKLGDMPAVLTCSGIGKVNAAINAQILITGFGCDGLLNTGIAGNLSKKLKLGDFVLADCVKYHDFDPDIFAQYSPNQTYLTPDKALSDKMAKTLDTLGIHYLIGTVASGDLFVQDSETKQMIIEKTAGLCTEMEGAAIGHTAARNGVPFAVLRCISDNSDDEQEYDNFFEAAAARCAEITVATVKSLAE